MTYSTDTKAAVMAALLAGQSISEVAAQYSIPEGTIKSWKSRQLNGRGTVATIASTKKEEIGELLLGYLTIALATLTKQAGVFADEEWLKEQPASELAVLHGVIADKSIRLLEALSTRGEESTDDAV